MKAPHLAALLTLAAPASAQTELFKAATGFAPFARCGDAVDMEGSWLAMGAPLEDTFAGVITGAVYVSNLNGPQGGVFAGVGFQDEFGAAVSIHQGVLWAGAPKTDSLGFNANNGVLYVHDLLNGTSSTVIGSGVQPNHQFGRAVAVHGDLAVAGNSSEDTLGNNAGRAYVFSSPGGVELGTLQPAGLAPEDFLGGWVDLLDGAALVSAAGRDAGASDTGALYLFDAVSGAQLQEYTLTTPVANAALRGPLVLQAGRVIATADLGGLRTVVVFDRASGAQLLTLNAADQVPGDGFGTDLAATGNRLIVGAPGHDGLGNNAGLAYLFDLGTGTQVGTLEASDGAAGDEFGRAVGASTGFLAAGAPLDDDGQPGTGSVYLFQNGQVLGETYCANAVANSTGAVGIVTVSGSPLVPDNDVTLVARNLPTNQFGIFLVSYDEGFVANPGGSLGNLCLGGTLARLIPANPSTGTTGRIEHPLDLGALPFSPPVAVQPFDLLHFQAWYRDANPGPGSNFTTAARMEFY